MTDAKLFFSSYIPVTNKEQKLPDTPCRFVMLTASSFLNTNPVTRILPEANGNYKNLGKEIYWGTENFCVHQLFITESTILIPVSNAKDISFYCLNPDANQIIAFSCFK